MNPSPNPPTGHRQDADRALYQAVIDRQDAEITFLREQLDQRSRELAAERERSDTITQMALLRIEALTSGSFAPEVDPDDTGHDATDEPSDRPRREQPAQNTESRGHRESHVAGWLRRLVGRS